MHQYDPLAKQVLDMTSFYMDISASNEKGQPVWKKLYNFRKTYGVQDLSLSSLKRVLSDFRTNDRAWMAYNAYKTALHDQDKTEKMCLQTTQTYVFYLLNLHLGTMSIKGVLKSVDVLRIENDGK